MLCGVLLSFRQVYEVSGVERTKTRQDARGINHILIFAYARLTSFIFFLYFFCTVL
jgi:hypothetical protein